MNPITLNTEDALLVIDLQNDFLPGGALAVAEGNAVIEPINALVQAFSRAGAHVLLTQDWHPPGHLSFASSHPGCAPFEQIQLPYGEQTLWPDHCVQGTRGASMTNALNADCAELIIRKGYNVDIDSYSAFQEADHKTPTGLRGYLNERGIKRVFCAGLALDFCVFWTACDAVAAGLDTTVIVDACRAIDLAGSKAASEATMKTRGVAFCQVEQLL